MQFSAVLRQSKRLEADLGSEQAVLNTRFCPGRSISFTACIAMSYFKQPLMDAINTKDYQSKPDSVGRCQPPTQPTSPYGPFAFPYGRPLAGQL